MIELAGRGPAAAVRGLALASHPGPTVAVTALSTALAVGAGAGPWRTIAVASTVLAGQLSIGWSNDWIDASRDSAVARSDKPVATGSIDVRTVRSAAFVALGASAVLSTGLGWRAALLHLAAVVGSGWAYNLGLKRTFWSWLPYLVCFGLLPAVVTLALPTHPFAPAWAIGTGALLGVGAHLANVLPDLEDDAATGVRGFPHRLGRTRTAALAPLALLAATVCVTLGPVGPPTTVGLVGVAAATGLAMAAGVIALRRRRSRLPFTLTIAVAALDVALLIAAGGRLG